MWIRGVRNVVENDDTPDKQTKLYIEQDFECRNPQCSNYEKVVDTARNEIELG